MAKKKLKGGGREENDRSRDGVRGRYRSRLKINTYGSGDRVVTWNAQAL